MTIPPSGLTTRAASPADAAAIAAIYNQGIEERIATFETRLRTPADILPWFDAPYPVVVVEEMTGEADRARSGRRVVGFAVASAYRPRECYAGIAEYSVYVDGAARGRGVGGLALEALFAAAESAGYWKLVSRIFVENTASRALMRRMGFREVGVYERHARLDGAWRDVVIVEKLLGPALEE